jgi:DNA-binding NarL/FixJ family response regulator
MEEIKIAIFEDNKLLRDALQAIMDGTPGYNCCGVFADAGRWENDIKRSGPHVVLMDIEMPGINGIEATKQICETFPGIKILIQTVFNDKAKIFAALCAGASGYILKTEPPHKYLEAIIDVYNGGAPFSSGIAKKILGFFTAKNVILVTPGEDVYHLSEREQEILLLMVKGENYKDIAAQIFISYETVRSHVKHIYKKLHVASRNEAVTKAIQKGIA